MRCRPSLADWHNRPRLVRQDVPGEQAALRSAVVPPVRPPLEYSVEILREQGPVLRSLASQTYLQPILNAEEQAPPSLLQDALRTRSAMLQIGRASCRERV